MSRAPRSRPYPASSCACKRPDYNCIELNGRSQHPAVLNSDWYQLQKAVYYVNVIHADAKELVRAVAPPGVFVVVTQSLKYRARLVEREVPQHVIHIPFLWYAGRLQSPKVEVAHAVEEKGMALRSPEFLARFLDNIEMLRKQKPIDWWHPFVAMPSFFNLLPIARKVIESFGGSGIGVPKNPDKPFAFHGEIPLIQVSATGILLMSTSGKKVQSALEMVLREMPFESKAPAGGVFQTLFIPAKEVEAPQPKQASGKAKKGQKKKGKKGKGRKGTTQAPGRPKAAGPLLSIPGAVIENTKFQFQLEGIEFEAYAHDLVEAELILDELDTLHMEDPLVFEDTGCSVCHKEHPPVPQKYEEPS